MGDDRLINVILISSVRPEPTMAANATLFRHLVNRPGINLTVLPAELWEIKPRSMDAGSSIIWRAGVAFAVGPLTRCCFRTVREWTAYSRRRPRRREYAGLYPGVWQRLACGETGYAARYALPLVAKFDDWWPDIAPVHGCLRGRLSTAFRASTARPKSASASATASAELGPPEEIRCLADSRRSTR